MALMRNPDDAAFVTELDVNGILVPSKTQACAVIDNAALLLSARPSPAVGIKIQKRSGKRLRRCSCQIDRASAILFLAMGGLGIRARK